MRMTLEKGSEMSYPRGLRERLLQEIASGQTVEAVADRHNVTVRSVYRWRDKQAHGLSLEPGRAVARGQGRRRKVSPDEEVALREQVATYTDATLAEHCAMWADAGHETMHPSTMSLALRRANVPKTRRTGWRFRREVG